MNIVTNYERQEISAIFQSLIASQEGFFSVELLIVVTVFHIAMY